MSSRVLLLCFIHGFKGSDDTFKDFPGDLQRLVGKQLPDHRVESVVYPKYETKGELSQATDAFVEWLKERVIDCRKAHFENPWPPRDRNVGVVLVAHSMGGFVAADALFSVFNERAANASEEDPIFPLIQGILTFDTPYNGLARSMFVYGSFSNYSKVNSVFNAMTALSAAAGPATWSRLGARQAASSVVPTGAAGRNPAWTAWQLVAVRTGTVGAIAAGGVAAYTHREAIMRGVRSLRNLNRDSIAQGYNQSVSTLGQGLAYVNRGNVGRSFAWLSDHFTFVGALMKQAELKRRLDRLAAVRGVGVHDFYCSLGENGYWSGGYFVPERTFCAVPAAELEKGKVEKKGEKEQKEGEKEGEEVEKEGEKEVEKEGEKEDQKGEQGEKVDEAEMSAARLFERVVMPEAEDEIKAHMNLFRPDKHAGYEAMTERSAELVKQWFLSEAKAVDEPRLREVDDGEKAESEKVEEALRTVESGDDAAAATEEVLDKKEGESNKNEEPTDDVTGLPDESPVDIAAAAALVPLPDSEGDLLATAADDASAAAAGTDEERRTYLQHLFRIAQNTGTEVRGWWPDKVQVPDVSSLAPALPKVPKVPASMSSAVSSLGNVSLPTVNLLKRKKPEQVDSGEADEDGKREKDKVED